MDFDPLSATDQADTMLQIFTAITSFGTAEIIALVCAVAALMCSAFCSGSEIAIFSLSTDDDRIDDSPRGDAIRRLLAKPERFLATILIANNLVNVTIVVLCNFALGPIFSNMSPAMSFILQTVLLTFLILLFGEIIPKLYCQTHVLSWANRAAGMLNVMVKLFYPLSSLLVKSTYIVNRVVPKRADNITTDELSQALDITDVSASDNKEMLQEILRFGDTTVAEVMTPRVDITDIDISWSFSRVMQEVIDSGYSRLPVYEDTQDNIKGILYARDLLPYIGTGDDTLDWRKLIRKPYFVPESRNIDDIFEDFRKMKNHMAIVIDEYGGTQGLVTLEDVIEEIVGDIKDEYDDDESTYKRLPNNTFIFEGRTLLNDFFRVTKQNSEVYEDVTEDCETLAGMLLAIKGDFPKNNESIEYEGFRFTVLNIENHRITSVKVVVKDTNSQDLKD